MRKCARRMQKGILILMVLSFLMLGEDTKAAETADVCQGSDGNWYYCVNGTVDYSYTGLADNENGWWYIKGGVVDFSKTGLVQKDTDWWYVAGGKVRFDYNGLAQNENGWWCIEDGQVMFGYTGLAQNENGWWYIQNGAVDFGYTGMANNASGWWYVAGGAVDFDYTGLGTNEAGTWYYQNGTIDFDYTGAVTVDGITYNVVGGKVDPNVKDGNVNVGLVSSDAQTVQNGTYSIALAANNGYRLAISDSSVKDGAELVTAIPSGGTNQLFNIKCIDSEKNLYTIQNVNSQKYLYTKESAEGGADVGRISQTGASDQGWYIQKNSDETYSFVSVNGNQNLAYAMADGRAELNKALFREAGNDQVSQKFVLEERTVGDAELETGIYTIGGKDYRISNLGSGVCTIYSLENTAFCSAGSDKVVYTALGTSSTAKWKVNKNGENYELCSVANGKYLTDSMGLSDSMQGLQVIDITASVTDYNLKYDLSTLNNLDGDDYKVVQSVKRMQMLSLSRDQLLNPQPNMIELENAIVSAMSTLPTEVVQYTGGNTVHELNAFMKQNMGKVVQLTADIEVYINQTSGDDNEDGVVLIPSNTILDGNGHKLVLRNGANVPSVGIEFYYIDDNNNWAQVTSENCGVKNLTTDIPYSASTLNAHGADKIVITGCNFSNAGLNAVVIADRDNNDPTVNGWITNNNFSSTGEDAIGVYGNISNLLIANNRINNSGEYGIMLSCLGEGDPIRVDAESDGPHDIIARENDIENSKSCAMYCLGTYRVYITGNKLYSSQLEGICLDTGCIGTYFAYNEVFNNGMTGGLPGVSIDNGIYNIVDGNNVHDNACNGIKLVRTGEGNIIVNNICTNNSANIPQGSTNAGISIETKETTAEISYLDGYGSDSNVVINNTINGNHTHGIMISDNSATGWNANNVVKYNKVSAEYPYGTVDFSTVYNSMGDNIIQ